MRPRSSNARRGKHINWAHLITANLYIVVFVLVGCDPSVETVESTTDQTKLARIAVEAKDWDVRVAAVKKLTDQALLAKLAVEEEDAGVSSAAWAKLTDQALLAKLAVEARYAWDRLNAVEKLTDQALLAKIAVEDKDRYVRRAAVKKLTDQALLAKLAVEAKDGDVRVAAVEKLTDRALLARIAVEDENKGVCFTAWAKFTDQASLAKVAVEEKWLDIRVAAISKVTDQVLLRQWAEKDPTAAIRQAVVRRIADDSFLIQRLPAEPSAAVRASIVSALHEKDSLRLVAITAYHRKDREQALKRLRRRFQDPASDVKTTHKALAHRVEALATETNSGRLLALAVEGEFDILCTAAARRLSHSATLEQAALLASDREVLKILLAKVEDKAMLNRIAAAANDRAMRLAAAQKSGAKSWEEIFNAAATKGATVQMLGDSVAAVSLFPEVQPDAVDGVQNACLDLIKRGDESRIPEMVDLLESYGDKTLAEDYLNCDQPDLDAEARKWAHRRGYDVGTGYFGSHRVTWGSGR